MYGRQARIELEAVVGEQTHHHVIIIGAGVAGLGLTIPLQQPK
jgi:cation diffusion facilitator CzcD-associated flavoprotein CzcO